LVPSIATVQPTNLRCFVFLNVEVLPDDKLIAIASEHAGLLGVLSSQVHAIWALAAGARLGVGNDPVYNKSTCFECFPFPDLDIALDELGSCTAVVDENGILVGTVAPPEGAALRILRLAEQLDAHRKRQQSAHPGLTLTGMYNVLDKLRSGEPLTAKERVIHEQGLVSVLRQLHDELDAAVLDAYGWSDLTPLLRIAHGNDAPADGQTREDAKRSFDEAVLGRLVALNAERAAEEARGLVRWLRPEFQNPANGTRGEQADLDVDGVEESDADIAPVAAAASKAAPWPKDPVEQVRAVAEVLAAAPAPMGLDDIAARFTARGPWKKRLPQLLDMLVAVGRASEQAGRYSVS